MKTHEVLINACKEVYSKELQDRIILDKRIYSDLEMLPSEVKTLKNKLAETCSIKPQVFDEMFTRAINEYTKQLNKFDLTKAYDGIPDLTLQEICLILDDIMYLKEYDNDTETH